MKILGKMRWQNGRLEIWNWWRREWGDFTQFPWAVKLERIGVERVMAMEYDLYRHEIDHEGGMIIAPQHSPGWWCYQTLHKAGFQLCKSEEVVEDAA